MIPYVHETECVSNPISRNKSSRPDRPSGLVLLPSTCVFIFVGGPLPDAEYGVQSHASPDRARLQNASWMDSPAFAGAVYLVTTASVVASTTVTTLTSKGGASGSRESAYENDEDSNPVYMSRL